VARPNAIEAPRGQVEAPSRTRLHARLPMVNAHRIAHEAEHWLLHKVPRLTASLAHSNPGAHCGARAANDAPQEADHDTRQASGGTGLSTITWDRTRLSADCPPTCCRIAPY